MVLSITVTDLNTALDVRKTESVRVGNCVEGIGCAVV